MREARGPAWTDWLHERGIVALTGIDTRRSSCTCASAARCGRSPSRATASVEEALAAVAGRSRR
jgi:hypothetical protein